MGDGCCSRTTAAASCSATLAKLRSGIDLAQASSAQEQAIGVQRQARMVGRMEELAMYLASVTCCCSDCDCCCCSGLSCFVVGRNPLVLHFLHQSSPPHNSFGSYTLP